LSGGFGISLVPSLAVRPGPWKIINDVICVNLCAFVAIYSVAVSAFLNGGSNQKHES
jgi:hypothetical protein